MRLFPDDAAWQIRHGLYEPTLDHEGSGWGTAVFAPWAARHSGIVAAAGRWGRPEMAAERIDDADSWAWYALSRVAETLILPLQPPGDGGDWLGADAWPSFVTGIGGDFPVDEPFHPFLHGIVAVGMPHPHDPDLLRFRCPTLVDDAEEQWPWHDSHVEPRP